MPLTAVHSRHGLLQLWGCMEGRSGQHFVVSADADRLSQTPAVSAALQRGVCPPLAHSNDDGAWQYCTGWGWLNSNALLQVCCCCMPHFSVLHCAPWLLCLVVMQFGTPEEDAHRRDFTINSLFYNINTGVIEDFTKQ